ncbi:Putative osmoprotectant uptake system substrate-binding protein OsmF precursor [Sodalis glossinidius str. 'morsitans']|uniref:Osmoprotectant uptake system substrate-binding protein OsmF n=1 Tax=Sodalis glossinidius (strain morsitans) TaxID=343509 RepID=A0A193QIK1_SODGM|nr:Putative osmoprotectant uptake system substrate-binding protein OsmF precursor [Sodalis glossinidius str. 'morsitans']
MATMVNYGRVLLLAAMMLGITPAALAADTAVRVGSKIDTEGSLLGNIILQFIES